MFITAAESSEKTDPKRDSAITKPKEAKNPRKKFDFGGIYVVWKTIFDEDYLSSKVICFFFFNIGVFPLEFDEDDPLAGLLSDEEDDLASKPKPKKTSTPKNTRSSGIPSQGVLLVIHYFTMYSEFEMVQYTVQHLTSKKNLTLV